MRHGLAAIVLAVMLAPALASAQPAPTPPTIAGAAQSLKPGDYLWAPEVAPHGPLLLIVSLATQRATLYRNGIPIAISTVSTGRPGHRTPTGVFTILQRAVEHYSSLYDDAPMPYMQRLTWGGVALHGGNLPGYPASHGCIRLPHEFARLLYGVTHLGMTVIVTDAAAVPHVAPSDPIAWSEAGVDARGEWHPERAPEGPVSVVISGADRRMAVLRNGTLIGEAPVTIAGPLTGTSVFLLRGDAADPESWVEVRLPAAIGGAVQDLRGWIATVPEFRAAVLSILQPGATVVVTADSLSRSAAEQPLLESDAPAPGK